MVADNEDTYTPPNKALTYFASIGPFTFKLLIVVVPIQATFNEVDPVELRLLVVNRLETEELVVVLFVVVLLAMVAFRATTSPIPA